MCAIVKYLLIGNTLKIILHVSENTGGHKRLKKMSLFFKSNFCTYSQYLMIFSPRQIQRGFWVSVSKPSIKLAPEVY